MPLQKQVLAELLKSGIRDLSGNKSANLSDVKRVWNAAYVAYALGANPIGAQPSTLFIPTSGPADSLSGNQSAFVSDLAAGLQTFWTSGQWAPDPFFHYQASVASGFVSPTMSRQINDLDEAINGIAGDLHTYTTTMVKLLATNIQSGASAIVLLI